MKPTMLGYLSVVTASDLDGGRRLLIDFAATEGYTLAGIYADLPGQQGAFYAMFDHLRRVDAAAVAVPHLGHLAHLPALASADQRTASRYLHARLLVIAPTSGDHPRGNSPNGRPERGLGERFDAADHR